MKILVVEDESDIRDLIVLHLKKVGYEVEEAVDGTEALEKLKNNFQLILLDWMIPQISGLDIIKKIRAENNPTPILMSTAKSANEDIVLGLESGADDYLVKPFELSILLARVKALLRRSSLPDTKADTKKLTLGDIQIDTEAHKVFQNSEEISLTPYEFKLIATLAKHKGKVLTRDQLIQEVHGDGVAVIPRVVDTHVFGLRKKIGTASELIETVRGVGYRISSNA